MFSNVSSNRFPERMHSHIGCIFLFKKMHNYNYCICLTFPHCAFSNVDSKSLDQSRQSHTGCICLTFLHCVFSNEPSKSLPERMQSHIGCICLQLLQCDGPSGSDSPVTLLALIDFVALDISRDSMGPRAKFTWSSFIFFLKIEKGKRNV